MSTTPPPSRPPNATRTRPGPCLLHTPALPPLLDVRHRLGIRGVGERARALGGPTVDPPLLRTLAHDREALLLGAEDDVRLLFAFGRARGFDQGGELPAELVVLSACQTGLGKEVKGEGLIGLTRGFMYAGAKRVVVSLWSVNDKATSELMTNFYRGMLTKHERPAHALGPQTHGRGNKKR